ncbi:MBL fold metallo-hydrolase [Ottowia pentelensis]|uniref:MBL fold metallo-hydrolase n=1 Tax=Ottowia pentelensis TaxID=511108 RepID=UPI00363C3F51
MNDSHGIHVIDTGFVRPRLDAAYLIVEKGRGAFVDCGVNHSVPRLLAALADAGLAPADVDWLILTHVHLDHAGGAGELLRQLPEARLVVHPRGARHMIDPSRLWAGAAAVYGEAEMQRSYGRLVPVPAGRVVEAPDGHEVDLAGRRLICLDTPGHARHHNAIFDPASGWVFSGDTFGVSYREFDTAQGPFIVPATSPSEFDPPALHRSIDRLLALKPAAVCPTHYGPLTPVKRWPPTCTSRSTPWWASAAPPRRCRGANATRISVPSCARSTPAAPRATAGPAARPRPPNGW